MQNSTLDFEKGIDICDEATTQNGPILHLLPCKVKCTCDGLDEEERLSCNHPAKVDQYFTPIIRKAQEGEENNQCSASFRGRPLRGALVTLPEGYHGVVLKESKKAGSLNSDLNLPKRTFVKGPSFDSFYYWKLQNPPSQDEKITQALSYTRIAQSMHSPILLEDAPQT